MIAAGRLDAAAAWGQRWLRSKHCGACGSCGMRGCAVAHGTPWRYEWLSRDEALGAQPQQYHVSRSDAAVATLVPCRLWVRPAPLCACYLVGVRSHLLRGWGWARGLFDVVMVVWRVVGVGGGAVVAGGQVWVEVWARWCCLLLGMGCGAGGCGGGTDIARYSNGNRMNNS